MARRDDPSDDPTTPPHPAGGWSESVTTVKGAVVAHVNEGYLAHPSGVFDAQGQYLHQAVQWRGRALMTPPPLPAQVTDLPGRWLWAGVRMEHFGHFLMESLGRLWALGAEKVDGVLFIPEDGFRPDKGERALAGWQARLLQLLQIDLAVKLAHEPLRVQELVVPGQGFGLGPLIGGTARFRRFVADRFARDIAPEGGAKLYLSRSNLPERLGGIIREGQLEKELAEKGYEVFHPQDHALEVQIARYKAATHVIGLDGSALHLFGLVARPDQRVAVIRRRPGTAPDGIVAHLTGFTGRAPLVVDALRRNWVRSDRKGADNFSYGEVDFAGLAKPLIDQGFLAEGETLRGLSERRALDFIAKVEERLARKGLTYLPQAPDGTPLPPVMRPPKRIESLEDRKARRLARAR